MPDRLSPQQRSALMAKVRSYDTAPERLVRSALHRMGLRFRKHVGTVAGRPDAVFMTARVAVFVDGDFWHGYRYPAWKAKLQLYWQAKIERNRARDRKNFARLRRQGWTVMRLWEHEVNADVERCAHRVAAAVAIGMAGRADGAIRPSAAQAAARPRKTSGRKPSSTTGSLPRPHRPVRKES